MPSHHFWVIKHGIKASGMPAWGKSMGDEYIWGMVAFLQQLPKLDAAQYKALVASSGGHSHGGGESGEHHHHDDGAEEHHHDGEADHHHDDAAIGKMRRRDARDRSTRRTGARFAESLRRRGRCRRSRCTARRIHAHHRVLEAVAGGLVVADRFVGKLRDRRELQAARDRTCSPDAPR